MIEAKENHIFNLSQSIQELQLMVTSLKGLKERSKGDDSNQCAKLRETIATNELQIQVLKTEVETATDFLLE